MQNVLDYDKDDCITMHVIKNWLIEQSKMESKEGKLKTEAYPSHL